VYYLNVKNGTTFGPRKLSPTQQRKKRRLCRQRQQIIEKLRHNALRMHFELRNAVPFSHKYTVALQNFQDRHEKLLHRLYKLTGTREDPYDWVEVWVEAREEVLVAKELQLMEKYEQAKQPALEFENHPRWVEDWDRRAAEASQSSE
jgi:hypothetical protein